MYNLEEEIIHFVFLAFKDKKRKREDIELCFHSIMVGNMLKSMGCNMDTVYIGYLHDVIEDSDYDYNDLVKLFGEKIANGVLMVSEDYEIEDWVERKKAFIKKIEDCNDDVISIELCDKLQNLISDYDLYCKTGEEEYLNYYGRNTNLKWYYTELGVLFNKRIDSENEYLNRYNKIYNTLFNK